MQNDSNSAERRASTDFPRASRLLMRSALFVRRIKQSMTLGVRIVVLDAADRVFLVRHSYIPGWYIPGGGVEPGETVLEAAMRELREEGNIVATRPPSLHGIFLNERLSKRDHVTVFLLRDFQQTAPKSRNYEIIETGFFPVNDLPKDITEGSAARIAEIVEGKEISPYW